MAVKDLKAFEKHLRDLIKDAHPLEAEMIDIAIECYIAGNENKDFPFGTYQKDFETMYSDPEYATFERLKEKFKVK